MPRRSAAACQPAGNHALQGSKPLVAAPYGRWRQNQGQLLRISLYRAGAKSIPISEAHRSCVPPAPPEAAHARAGGPKAISETLLKRHARARPAACNSGQLLMMMMRATPLRRRQPGLTRQLGTRRSAVGVGGARFVGPGVAAGRQRGGAPAAMKRSDTQQRQRQKSTPTASRTAPTATTRASRASCRPLGGLRADAAVMGLWSSSPKSG